MSLRNTWYTRWLREYVINGVSISPFQVTSKAIDKFPASPLSFSLYRRLLFDNEKLPSPLNFNEEETSFELIRQSSPLVFRINFLFNIYGSLDFTIQLLQNYLWARQFFLKTIRGRRYRFKHPTHGQRTRSNFWTSAKARGRETTLKFFNEFRPIQRKKKRKKKVFKIEKKDRKPKLPLLIFMGRFWS